MFVQVIKARVKDEAGIRAVMDEWRRDLMSGADGYLGTTAGFCADGTFMALARFDSREAAMRNSDRPEQSAWWDRMSANFDGEAQFLDSDDVTPWLDGGSDDAGFVQVMVGHSPDVTRLREGGNEATDELRRLRPEIIGGMFAIWGDDGYVQTVYFRSEQEARDREGTEPPEEFRPMLEERQRLMGEVSYYDLRDPILVSR